MSETDTETTSEPNTRGDGHLPVPGCAAAEDRDSGPHMPAAALLRYLRFHERRRARTLATIAAYPAPSSGTAIASVSSTGIPPM